MREVSPVSISSMSKLFGFGDCFDSREERNEGWDGRRIVWMLAGGGKQGVPYIEVVRRIVGSFNTGGNKTCYGCGESKGCFFRGEGIGEVGIDCRLGEVMVPCAP